MEKLTQQLNELEKQFNLLRSTTTIPYDIEQAFRIRLANIANLPAGFQNLPLASITSPSGGLTIDSQARSSIDAIITRLEDLGLVAPN